MRLKLNKQGLSVHERNHVKTTLQLIVNSLNSRFLVGDIQMACTCELAKVILKFKYLETHRGINKIDYGLELIDALHKEYSEKNNIVGVYEHCKKVTKTMTVRNVTCKWLRWCEFQLINGVSD